MKNKKWIISFIVIGIITFSWLSGFVPKQIAKIAGSQYAKKHYPEMQLEFIDVEWAEVFGDYLITFKGENEKIYSCVIGPKLLPISMGQGLFDIESDYQDNYK